MVRVRKFHAEAALEVLEAAKDVGDAMVINACRRVRQGWLLAHRVASTDIQIVRDFAEG